MKHFTALTSPRIDSENGIIRTVSLMEKGEAKGHYDKQGRQVMVDDMTLEQVFQQCKKLGSIKVKADHGSGVFEIVGWADNFSLTSNKVTADVHIYDSEPNRPRLLEIAEKNPTHMGISMEFTGEDKAQGKVCMSRCDEVIAAALVDDPAANSSLFSATLAEQKNETNINNMETEPEKTEPTADDKIKQLEDQLAELSSKFASKFECEEEEKTELADGEEVEKSDDETEMGIGSLVKQVGKSVTKDMESNEEEEEESKKIELAAERIAEKLFRKMTSNVGMTQLSKPGVVKEKVKEKSFNDIVSEVAQKEFNGDTVKAQGAILTNFSKYPEAKKAYETSRNIKHI